MAGNPLEISDVVGLRTRSQMRRKSIMENQLKELKEQQKISKNDDEMQVDMVNSSFQDTWQALPATKPKERTEDEKNENKVFTLQLQLSLSQQKEPPSSSTLTHKRKVADLDPQYDSTSLELPLQYDNLPVVENDNDQNGSQKHKGRSSSPEIDIIYESRPKQIIRRYSNNQLRLNKKEMKNRTTSSSKQFPKLSQSKKRPGSSRFSSDSKRNSSSTFHSSTSMMEPQNKLDAQSSGSLTEDVPELIYRPMSEPQKTMTATGTEPLHTGLNFFQVQLNNDEDKSLQNDSLNDQGQSQPQRHRRFSPVPMTSCLFEDLHLSESDSDDDMPPAPMPVPFDIPTLNQIQDSASIHKKVPLQNDENTAWGISDNDFRQLFDIIDIDLLDVGTTSVNASNSDNAEINENILPLTVDDVDDILRF